MMGAVAQYKVATTGGKNGFMAVLLCGCSYLILLLNKEGVTWCVDKCFRGMSRTVVTSCLNDGLGVKK